MSNYRNKGSRSAISLQYDREIDKAPIVTAKGKGLIAEKIIALALENNIPVKEDPDLVHLLSQVDLNSEIPASLYHVVAELLSFVYNVNSEYSTKIK